MSKFVGFGCLRRRELYKKAGKRYAPEEIARRKEFDEEFGFWLDGVRGGIGKSESRF